jgi:hypothetical protein
MWNDKDPNYTKLLHQLQNMKHREKRNSYMKEYYKNNAEKRKAYAKEYRERNAERLRDKRKARRAKAALV